MGGDRSLAVEDQLRRLYEEAESQTARAWEGVVHRDAFGELLARMTENAMSVMRLSNDAFDLVIRNMRIAGRGDITKLAGQLARTEDKLEMVLQEVEHLQEELRAERADRQPTNGRRAGDGTRTRAQS
jgi:hypothetical protein